MSENRTPVPPVQGQPQAPAQAPAKANGSDNVATGGLLNMSAADWAKACGDAGYCIRNGKPLIGISDDNSENTVGYIVELDFPKIDPVNLARALCAHALRVGQSGLKAANKDDRSNAVATESANRALNGTYEPQTKRENDILESESMVAFKAMLAEKIREKSPDATDAVINNTVNKEKDTDRGKAWLKAKRDEIDQSRTYTIARRRERVAKVAITDLTY